MRAQRQYSTSSSTCRGAATFRRCVDPSSCAHWCSRCPQAATHPPPLSKEERQALFAKCFARTRDTAHATGWFHFAPESAIHRENVVEWILWALFSTSRAGAADEWREEIEEYVQRIEHLLGRKLAPGWNAGVDCIKVTLDPVTALHRPLLWYMVVGLVDLITSMHLVANGFKHYTLHRWFCYFPPRFLNLFWARSPHPHISYWYRPHRSTTKKPIVFFHGIGIGLWPYLPFFTDIIARDPDVGILAIENLPISMRISPPPLARPAMLDGLALLLSHHGLDRFVVCGHSYGTVVAAHVMRCPALAARATGWLLVDPIPFLLHLPAVAHNFVYRAPRGAHEWQLWYFASRDADIARALARHFFWAESTLWREDLAGRRVAVALGARDQIVDAPEVRAYLTGGAGGGRPRGDVEAWTGDGGRLQVLWYPALDHAMVFDTARARRPMVEILARFVGADVA
ncbi:hypothetical protein PHLGIDRAFT_79868 [Phlebiopsis gigantea 11061_1 CR5-6]|uniref:AB hydrolase-1 domain-containing protein n=1 Tax=Phlebiopsis gigantea (strain 11061_1 CR5-6) TaxID=745531 RepID=A0A0C3NBT2_PHLG1|nr:hypothetical protein PHLGIDRAFT_79868 [Phlebiopsis gigantea 11061_1 CR5-6]